MLDAVDTDRQIAVIRFQIKYQVTILISPSSAAKPAGMAGCGISR
jgi:hypothetical protein